MNIIDKSEEYFFRALLKDLKKATKEKQRLLKSSDKERWEDIQHVSRRKDTLECIFVYKIKCDLTNDYKNV